MYAYLRKCYAVNPNDSYAPGLMGYICWIGDPEFQAILAEMDKQNAGKRARILATEKSYQT
jgi:hypothetical protein